MLAKLALGIYQWQELLGSSTWNVLSILSSLSQKLSSLFFFHLFKCFKEKLLDITSLIKNHLA
jgi:hypothetical protein